MLAWLSAWGADLHIAQQMTLPLTISCSSKSRLVLTFLVLPFWYLLTRVDPDIFQTSSKTVVCVCVCVLVYPGELLPKETFTHSHLSWSSTILSSITETELKSWNQNITVCHLTQGYGTKTATILVQIKLFHYLNYAQIDLGCGLLTHENNTSNFYEYLQLCPCVQTTLILTSESQHPSSGVQ